MMNPNACRALNLFKGEAETLARLSESTSNVIHDGTGPESKTTGSR